MRTTHAAPGALLVAMITLACARAAAPDADAQAPDVLAPHVDSAIDPGTDFYGNANGAWFKANPIPAAESHWGIDKLVEDDLYAKLRAISERAAANGAAAPGSDARKVGDFWGLAMDEGRAQRLGLAPLQADLARIDAIRDPRRRPGRRLRAAAAQPQPLLWIWHRPG